jgi:hypothetical protein
MTPKTIHEDDEFGSPISSERPDTGPAVGRTLPAMSRHRVLLGSVGIAVVAVLAWRWTVSSESTPIAPSAAFDAASAVERKLEITVLGVHDAVAAAVPAVPAAPPEPPVAVPLPPAAPASADPPPVTVSPPPRAHRSGRGQSSSAAKAAALPVPAKVVPAQEPHVEIAPVKPQPKPDGPPMETNPYVYK